MWLTVRPTSTRAGRSSIRRSGSRRIRLRAVIDSRGAGRSPGYIDPFSPRETKDFYLCIEWAGVQRLVERQGRAERNLLLRHQPVARASLAPPHLAAMCIWEGAADWYRDMTHHGGILSTFWANWYDMQVKTVQYGLGERGPAKPGHGRTRLRR